MTEKQILLLIGANHMLMLIEDFEIMLNFQIELIEKGKKITDYSISMQNFINTYISLC
ncbi:hypothetical protein Phi48:2_gp06 [Cellulophaga phage phi48:2]|uniref:hypothetical protein n=1 Tax=Cellulophaga phage phi48:2 TaxID=1327968 RepID=UPI0003519DE2|nr:hypothetical protein Phi48:2_gp06 [Cellulophaga phage phi48:2]AGO47254.1 hypothetical protein Phi48:2_gp06 [Cellulophaga phage phi48:2]